MALAFDNGVHRRFRQMMPLSQTDILTDLQLEQRLGDMVDGVTVCERLANEPDLSVWQVSPCMVLVSNLDRGWLIQRQAERIDIASNGRTTYSSFYPFRSHGQSYSLA